MLITKDAAELLREIRQCLAELELISHAPTLNIRPEVGKNAGEHPGGKRPQGTDRENPVGAMERLDAFGAYQAKSVERYRRWLASILEHRRDPEKKLAELLKDLEDTLEGWRRPPIKLDMPPTMADPGWKRFVVTCGWDVDKLVNYYGCSRQYIKRVLASDWSARNESVEDRLKRERKEWERRRAA